EALRALGAEPVVCDVFDADAVRDAIVAFAPVAIIQELTDLPDDQRRIGERAEANIRIRREGTRNLLAASQAAGTVSRFLAQSVAWQLAGDGCAAAEALERAVLGWGGVV